MIALPADMPEIMPPALTEATDVLLEPQLPPDTEAE